MKCPYCYENINGQAIVCPFCRRDLQFVSPIITRIDRLEGKIKAIEIFDENIEKQMSAKKTNTTNEYRNSLGLIFVPLLFSILASVVFRLLLTQSGYTRIEYLFIALFSPLIGGILAGIIYKNNIIHLASGIVLSIINYLGILLVNGEKIISIIPDIITFQYMIVQVFLYVLPAITANGFIKIKRKNSGNERFLNKDNKNTDDVYEDSANDKSKVTIGIITPVFSLIGTIITCIFGYLNTFHK